MKTSDSVNSDDSSRLPSDMGHTPTPWQQFHDTDYDCFRISNKAKYPTVIARTICDQKDDQANAAFIVRAANSHQALVEALEAVIEPMQVALDGAEWREANLPAGALPLLHAPQLRFALAAAREALRSATP